MKGKIKKILGGALMIFLLVIGVVALMPPVTSITPIGGSNSWIRPLGGMMVDSVLRVPKGFNGRTSYYTGVDSFGWVCINPFDSSLWINNGIMWKRVGDSPGTGGAYIGMLITGGGAVNAILYRNAGGQLNASSLLGFSDASGIFSLLDNAGDTMEYTNATSKLVAFYINKVVYGKGAVKDTFDFSGLTTGRKVTWQDAPGTVAYLSNITSQNVAQVDTLALTDAESLRVYTTPAIGTYIISGYLNVTAVSTDHIIIRISWTDENSVSQTYQLVGAVATGFVPGVTATIRAKSGTTITAATILTVSGGSITYDAGVVIQLNHS